MKAVLIGFFAVSSAYTPLPPVARCSRRAVTLGTLSTALPLLCSPLPARAMDLLTPSQMLTAGEYVRDLKEARRGLDPLDDLLALDEDRGYSDARVALRKPPVSGVRKAATKLLAQLPERSETLDAKSKLYEQIKADLGNLDEACKPDASHDRAASSLEELRTHLDAFVAGLRIDEPPNPDPPAEPYKPS